MRVWFSGTYLSKTVCLHSSLVSDFVSHYLCRNIANKVMEIFHRLKNKKSKFRRLTKTVQVSLSSGFAATRNNSCRSHR